MSVGVAAEIKTKLSVVDVVGETVQLKKAGTTYKGLCPFHGEKTPSFTVTPARESGSASAAALGGDVFSFVMQRDGVTFPEALKVLAAKAGVELDERTTREDARKRPPARRPRGGDRLLPRGPDRLEARPARARLPARPRLHRRDDRDASSSAGRPAAGTP